MDSRESEGLKRSLAKPDVQRLPPVATQTLRTVVHKALTNHGKIYSIPHCQKHMIDRGFDMNDVVEILMNGDYEQYEPEWREDHENWIYFAVGEDLEGERLKIIFSIHDADYRIRLIGGERYFRGKRV